MAYDENHLSLYNKNNNNYNSNNNNNNFNNNNNNSNGDRQQVMGILRDIGENLTVMKKMVNSIGVSNSTEERKNFLSLRADVKTKLEQATSVLGKVQDVRTEVEKELGHYVNQFRSLVQTATHRLANNKPYNPRPKYTDSNAEYIPLLTKEKPNLSSTNNGTSGTNYRTNSKPRQMEMEMEMEMRMEMQKELQIQMEINNMNTELESELLEEHNEKMSYIKEEFSEMKEMLEEMHDLVESQDTNVEMLSDSVLQIKEDTQESIKHITKTAGYAVAAGRNRCLLLLFLLIITFVMGAFLWTVNKRHDGGKG